MGKLCLLNKTDQENPGWELEHLGRGRDKWISGRDNLGVETSESTLFWLTLLPVTAPDTMQQPNR